MKYVQWKDCNFTEIERLFGEGFDISVEDEVLHLRFKVSRDDGLMGYFADFGNWLFEKDGEIIVFWDCQVKLMREMGWLE